MEFPTREADILRLANDIAAGLAAHADIFVSPPHSPDEFRTALAAHDTTREANIAAHADAARSTVAKGRSLAAVEELAKSTIRYAENITKGDDGKLQLIGWGGRRARSNTEVPGQVRTLEVIREGKTWLFLDWKEPVDGGAVAAYRIQRRKRDTGDWLDVGMSVESEITLNAQEPGVEFEYHVIAVNKAGEGPVSNIVRAVL